MEVAIKAGNKRNTICRNLPALGGPRSGERSRVARMEPLISRNCLVKLLPNYDRLFGDLPNMVDIQIFTITCYAAIFDPGIMVKGERHSMSTSEKQTHKVQVPPVLAGVPVAVVNAIDLTSLLLDTASLLSPPTDVGVAIAFGSIETYLDAAKRQQRRIRRARSTFLIRIRSGRPKRDNLFNEVHFYLICWARIAKLGTFIRDKTRFRQVGLVMRRYHSELQKRVDCRDHLEHFEERLPGGSKQSKLQHPNDLLNMANEHVTYGGRKLDVGPASIRLLKTIVSELRRAILFDAIEGLAMEDSQRLEDLLQCAQSDMQIRKIMKATRAEWKDMVPQKDAGH